MYIQTHIHQYIDTYIHTCRLTRLGHRIQVDFLKGLGPEGSAHRGFKVKGFRVAGFRV